MGSEVAFPPRFGQSAEGTRRWKRSRARASSRSPRSAPLAPRPWSQPWGGGRWREPPVSWRLKKRKKRAAEERAEEKGMRWSWRGADVPSLLLPPLRGGVGGDSNGPGATQACWGTALHPTGHTQFRQLLPSSQLLPWGNGDPALPEVPPSSYKPEIPCFNVKSLDFETFTQIYFQINSKPTLYTSHMESSGHAPIWPLVNLPVCTSSGMFLRQFPIPRWIGGKIPQVFWSKKADTNQRLRLLQKNFLPGPSDTSLSRLPPSRSLLWSPEFSLHAFWQPVVPLNLTQVLIRPLKTPLF